jgi:hypothetical protein
LWDTFALLDPDPDFKSGSGSTDPIESGDGSATLAVQDWIFPASKLWVAYSQTGHIPTSSSESTTTATAGATTTATKAVCQSVATTTAAFDLLVALCTNCPANLSLLARMLAHMFYTTECGSEALTEWEYLPPVGPRPSGGFVGLKNAGYMNCVLQQLFMLEDIRQERQCCCRQRIRIVAIFAQKAVRITNCRKLVLVMKILRVLLLS